MWENALIVIKQAPLFGHSGKGYESFKEQQVKSNQMKKTHCNLIVYTINI